MVLSLWERAFQKQFDQQTSEQMVQLIDCQLDATSMLSPGPLQRDLSKAWTGILLHVNKGNPSDRLHGPYRECV
jgi:hypothetical protein